MNRSISLWEYMRVVVEETTLADWNKWGREGWEIVAISKGVAYFKRALP